MKVFLIILAVLVVLFLIILSLSVDLTVVYDGGWNTKIGFLFIEKDVELSKLLSFVLFPDKAGKQAAEEQAEKKSEEDNVAEVDVQPSDDNKETTEKKPVKPNYIQKIWNDEGVVGIMLLFTNLIETVNSAITTLFKGLHIYSLYVKIIVGGNDAADIANDYGTICGIFYPIKGFILNGMRVDNYDDYIQADFIAPFTETEFQLVSSINVRLVLKMLLKAGFVFIKNYINNK